MGWFRKLFDFADFVFELSNFLEKEKTARMKNGRSFVLS